MLDDRHWILYEARWAMTLALMELAAGGTPAAPRTEAVLERALDIGLAALRTLAAVSPRWWPERGTLFWTIGLLSAACRQNDTSERHGPIPGDDEDSHSAQADRDGGDDATEESSDSSEVESDDSDDSCLSREMAENIRRIRTSAPPRVGRAGCRTAFYFASAVRVFQVCFGPDHPTTKLVQGQGERLCDGTMGVALSVLEQ